MAVTKKKRPAATKTKAAKSNAKTKARPKAKAKAKSATPKKKAAAKKAPVKKTATTTAAKTRGAGQRPQPSVRSKPADRQALLETATFMGYKPYRPKKGEPYMSEGQVEHFRSLLGNWKKALMEEVDRTVHHMQDEAANFPDPNDRASQESDFTMELRTRDRERKLIKKIDESLTDLNIGEYGYCESCGVEIGIRRLEARPTATLCIDCKQLEEIREKKMRE